MAFNRLSGSTVKVSKLAAKLLQNETVLCDLFGELMDYHCSIERSSIASGNILVTHGDPKTVADIIHKVVIETEALDYRSDKGFLRVLNSLKEKYPGQFEIELERSSSTLKTAFHRQINNEIVPSIMSFAKTNRLQRHLELSRALFLSGTRGQKEVIRIAEEHHCQVSVILPGYQVLVRGEHPGGHRLLLCEGNMAATDCSVVLLPFSESHNNWSPTHKLILQRGLLTDKYELYSKYICGFSKARTLKLQSQRPNDRLAVVLLHVPDTLVHHSLLAEGLEECLKLSFTREACIALPVAMSARQSLEENMKNIVSVVQNCLDKEENATTIVLYLEKSSAIVRQKLVETLENTMSARWKIEMDRVAVYEETISSPTLVIVGQTRAAETTFTKLQTMYVPNDFQERSSLLDTVMKSGSNLCTASSPMISNFGAGSYAKVTVPNTKSKNRNNEDKTQGKQFSFTLAEPHSCNLNTGPRKVLQKSEVAGGTHLSIESPAVVSCQGKNDSKKNPVIEKLGSEVVDRLLQSKDELRRLSTDLGQISGKFKWKRPDSIIVTATKPDIPEDWCEQVIKKLDKYKHVTEVNPDKEVNPVEERELPKRKRPAVSAVTNEAPKRKR